MLVLGRDLVCTTKVYNGYCLHGKGSDQLKSDLSTRPSTIEMRGELSPQQL